MSELKKRILLALQRDEAASLKELEKLTGSYASSISRSIKGLRIEGLVDEHDYKLTERGEEVKEALAKEYTERLREIATPVGSYLDAYVAKVARAALATQRLIGPKVVAMAEETQRIFKSVQPLMEQMEAQRAVMEASLSHMFFQLQPYYASIQELAEYTKALRIPTVFSRDALEAMRLVAKQYQKMHAKLIESFRQFAEFTAFIEEEEFKKFDLNWLAFLPVDVMKQIYELHKQGKEREIWDFLKNIHRDEEYIDQLMEDLEGSKIFKPRMRIIKDASQAHLAERYTLSVPVLLTQVEGILWDIGEKKGIVSGKEITTMKGKKTEAHSAKQLLKQTMLKDFLFPNFVDYFTNKVYIEDNRHAIMHGRSISYPIEKNSVLAMMMLRLLLQYCKEVEE